MVGGDAVALTVPEVQPQFMALVRTFSPATYLSALDVPTGALFARPPRVACGGAV
jgi:hypothetical protein